LIVFKLFIKIWNVIVFFKKMLIEKVMLSQKFENVIKRSYYKFLIVEIKKKVKRKPPIFFYERLKLKC